GGPHATLRPAYSCGHEKRSLCLCRRFAPAPLGLFVAPRPRRPSAQLRRFPRQSRTSSGTYEACVPIGYEAHRPCDRGKPSLLGRAIWVNVSLPAPPPVVIRKLVSFGCEIRGGRPRPFL